LIHHRTHKGAKSTDILVTMALIQLALASLSL
jgi:hypothetical protein